MANALDELEAAKLAAMISGELRGLDKNTDGVSIPANRIDPRAFQQRVVAAANNQNPDAVVRPPAPSLHGGDPSLLEFLNRQAASQVPDITGPPEPAAYIPPLIPQPAPVQNAPAVPVVPYSPPPQQMQTNQLDDIANSLRGIDNSLKAVCDFFIQKNIKKKRKRKAATKPKLQLLTEVIPVVNQQENPTLQSNPQPPLMDV